MLAGSITLYFVEAEHEEERLSLASLTVSVPLALFLLHLIFPDGNPLLGEAGQIERARLQLEREASLNRIYPVLVEQKEAPPPETDQIRALSSVTAEGKGGITEKTGFHTLSPYDVLESGASNNSGAVTLRKETGSRPEKPQTAATKGQKASGSAWKIPANYRFEQDFALRYDSSGMLSVARQELAGFSYFQSMLRQIQDSFAPPGMNYAYRDHAGYVINQPIKPQVVKVQFLLDESGTVRDVRKISSLGQSEVDEACLNTLRNQNFGPPPPEVFQHGNIFGINFVFPAVRF